MCSGACISTATESCICHKGTEMFPTHCFSLSLSLIFDVLLFRIPTKSIVHFFFVGRHCYSVPFQMKANFRRRKIMKNNFSLENDSFWLSVRSPCFIPYFLFVNISIEKWAYWKWTHAMHCLTNTFSISLVMIFVIIWNLVNSK